MPVTRTIKVTRKIVSTKLVLRTSTRTKAVIAGLKQREVMFDEPPADGLIEPEPISSEPELENSESRASVREQHDLFARNICPQCPAGISAAPLAAGKTGRGCCPKRRTITQRRTVSRTIRRRKTVKRFKTITIRLPRVGFIFSKATPTRFCV